MRKILFCGMVIFIWDSSAPGVRPYIVSEFLFYFGEGAEGLGGVGGVVGYEGDAGVEDFVRELRGVGGDGDDGGFAFFEGVVVDGDCHTAVDGVETAHFKSRLSAIGEGHRAADRTGGGADDAEVDVGL